MLFSNHKLIKMKKVLMLAGAVAVFAAVSCNQHSASKTATQAGHSIDSMVDQATAAVKSAGDTAAAAVNKAVDSAASKVDSAVKAHK
jgi:uncharacterized lipoprotein YajG